MNTRNFLVAIAMLSAAVWPCAAQGQVGEPASFDISVRQGGSVIAQGSITIGPGGDLEDIKTTWQDGDPEDFTPLQVMTGSGNPSPVILKLVSEPTANQDVYRLLHFYLNVPISLQNINLPGPDSLFGPNGLIDVTISNMTISNGVSVEPRVENEGLFYTSFMRDYQGHFYESVGAHPYNYNGGSIYDIQVPGTKYHDGDMSQYVFNSTPGFSSSWTWGNIVPPGLTTNVHNGASSVAPSQPGYVFELGLSVALVVIPEPTSLSLLAIGFIAVLGRRRRR